MRPRQQLEISAKERQAIIALRRGDLAGLELLVLRHQTSALRAAYGILQDGPLAQDVVQSAFVRLPQRIQHFDPSRPFAPWFLRVVAHDAIDAIRRERRNAPLENSQSTDQTWLDGLPAQGPSPEALAERAASSAELWALIGQLSPEQRAVVVLRYYSGLSTAEVAENLSIPAGTVRWRLHAAHERLRGWLKRLGWATDRQTGAPDPEEVDHV